MILFPIYAALVLYGVYRLRRRFLGVALLAASLLGLLALGWLDLMVGYWVTGRKTTMLFRMMLGVEGALLLPLGVYLWSVRRERIEIPCRRCGYELFGLEQANPTCPECGMACAAEAPKPATVPVPAPAPAEPEWRPQAEPVPAAA